VTTAQQYRFQLPTQTILGWVGLASSSYYYRPRSGPRGIAASTHTWTRDGAQVANSTIVESIKNLLLEEFVCYCQLPHN